jgi:hypothetical protein
VPLAAAHYESYFLQAWHPRGGLAVWIRYTVHKPPHAQARGALWFTLFDADAGVLASKAAHPRPEAPPGEYIRLGESSFAPSRVSGHAPSARLDAAWELSVDGDEPPLWHLPARWMYRAPLPRTKLLAPHPQVVFRGLLAAGERRVEVDGWPGTIGHNWGSEHAERAIWLHGSNFEGAQAAWLDVGLARVRIGPLTTPWLAAGALSLDRRRWRLGGLARTRATSVRETPEGARFVLGGEGVVVEGEVGAPRERFVGWIYAQPRGGERQTVNSAICDMRVCVRRPGQPDVRLERRGGAAYELQTAERDPAIALQPFGDG